jgi:two-component system chemotaxis response regulator CheB
MALKVLVVDDSAYHRRTLSRMIGAAPGFEVVGTAGDGEEAIKKVVTLQPDLLTLDLEMPRMDGYTFLRWLMRTLPRPTLVVSSRESNKSVFRALELGAADFVVKPVSYASERLGQIEGELVAKLREIAAASGEKLAARSRSLAETTPGPAVRKKAVSLAVPGRRRCVAIALRRAARRRCSRCSARWRRPAGGGGHSAACRRATRMFAERLDRIVGLRQGGRGDENWCRPGPAGPGRACGAPGLSRRSSPARGAGAGHRAMSRRRTSFSHVRGGFGSHSSPWCWPGWATTARWDARSGRRADHRRGRILRGLRDAAGGDPDRRGAWSAGRDRAFLAREVSPA